MDANVVIGSIVLVFGVVLILFKGVWRSIGRGIAKVSVVTNNMHFWPFPVKFSVDERYKASDKGLIVVGVIFIILGFIILLL